jgi:hypothetical protein
VCLLRRAEQRRVRAAPSISGNQAAILGLDDHNEAATLPYLGGSCRVKCRRQTLEHWPRCRDALKESSVQTLMAKPKPKKLDPPRQLAGDLAHSTARAIVGMIPGGSAALEFFNNVIVPPLKRRRQKWMDNVAEAIRELEQNRGVKVEDLQQNESFITTVMQATQIAVRNHEQEKLDALRNAVLNSALPHAPDDSLQEIFLAYVDRFTVWHLRLLAFLHDPKGWFAERGRQFPSQMIGALGQILTTAYPELRDQRPLYDLVAKDLWNNGLLNTDGLHAIVSAQGAGASRTSDIGKRFLQFIT